MIRSALFTSQRYKRKLPPSAIVGVSVVAGPSLLSAAIENQALSASSGSYAGTAPITIARQWQISADNSAWSDSAGETGLTRSAFAAGDVNKYVRLREIASNAAGALAAQYTASVQITAANPPGSGTATITFTPTDGITDYRVAWGAEHDSETYTQDYAGVTGTITVTGLEAGTLYFKVRPLPNGDWYSLGPVVIA